MKRIALIVALMTTLLVAQTGYVPGSLAISLSGVTVTGRGTVFSLPTINGQLPNKFTWQVIVAGGVATAITTNLEGSLDNTTFSQYDQSTSTSGETRSVVNKPARFIDCNITTYTTNGTNATCQIIATY